MAKLKLNHLCPCESGKSYSACCQPYHLGKSTITAEALMRSRYTAFVLSLEEYLIKTWHSSTRPLSLDLHKEPLNWIGLKVKHTVTIDLNSAIVEFIARYKVNGKAQRLHEISQFKFEDGNWYYLTGKINEVESKIK